MFRIVAVSSFAIAAVLISPVVAQAQQAADADVDQGADEALIVVGRLTDTLVDREQLDRVQANDLSDIFRSTPSVAVGGSLGIAQKIYVRGLEDSQLNVTIDGAP